MSFGIKRVYIEENNHSEFDDYGNYRYTNIDLDTPSAPGINDQIKGIDRKNANLEAEKGEALFDNQKLTLHKIMGKPHSKGGTPLNLNKGDFIFSNDKSLNINKKEKNLFELKFGGTTSPAKTLMKEIDFKHHNKMLNILDNSKLYDSITKNSAVLMLTKNMEKIGQIAHIQEAKKGFPQGNPDFSLDSMPVYSSTIDKQITQAEQYKYGGRFLPKAQGGGKWVFALGPYGKSSSTYNYNNPSISDTPIVNSGRADASLLDYPYSIPQNTNNNNPWYWKALAAKAINEKNQNTNPTHNMSHMTAGDNNGYPSWLNMWTKSNTEEGRITPTGRISTYRTSKGNDIYDDYNYWRNIANRDFKDAKDYQQFVYDKIWQNNPNSITKMWTEMGPTALGMNTNSFGFADGYFGDRTAQLTGMRLNNVQVTKPEVSNSSEDITPEKPYDITPTPLGSIFPNSSGQSTKAWEPNIPLSYGQMLNIAAPSIMGALFDKSIDPYRMQQKSVTTEPQYLSDVPYLNSINNNFNAQANLSKTVAPSLSLAYLQDAYGNARDKSLEVIGDIQNKNRTIKSQSDSQKAAYFNADSIANTQFNKRYFDENTVKQIGINSMKEKRFVDTLNNFNDAISQNEALSNMLGMLNADSPRYKDVKVFNKSTGKYEIQRQQVPYYDVKRKGFGFTTYQPEGNFDIKNYRMNNNKVDSFKELYDELYKLTGQQPTIKDLVTAAASKRFGSANTSN